MSTDLDLRATTRRPAIVAQTWGRLSSLPVREAFQPRETVPATKRSPASPHANVRPAPLLCLLLAVVALLGCKSVSVSSYISPRVIGRVLAADTRQPIPNTAVRRINPNANQNYGEPAKASQRLDSTGGVRSDKQGRFLLDAERDLTFLQQQIWFSVMVAFQHDGYQTLRTNFTAASVFTNAPDGAPLVNAGDILLHPASP